MRIIKFLFSAPLQSWGEDARWDNRSTAGSPTKSGIVGFLGGCLGYPRGDERLNQLDRNIRIAVRIDKPGRIMTDFQTVQGTDGKFLNAEGKPRTGGGTIITPKQYLQDARFTVFLQGEESLMEECFQAMLHPVWTPFLGRKNCIPSEPVIPEWVEADSLENAVQKFDEADMKHCEGSITVEMDLWDEASLAEMERAYNRNDSIVHAERNEYKPRRVKSYVISAGGGAL